MMLFPSTPYQCFLAIELGEEALRSIQKWHHWGSWRSRATR